MTKNVEGYAITKLKDDTTKVAELEKRVNLEEVMQSDSINNMISEFHIEDTVNLKDDRSFTADNSTPHSNLHESTPTSPIAKGIKKKNMFRCMK